MEVPYFDLKLQYDGLRGELLAALDRVCRTASFVLGEEVARFEEEFAAYCGVRHCVGLNSGTSALHLALLAVGVRPGDEVITTPNTFIATAEAISYVGARPVFVDIHPATANLDPARIEAAITARTRAIVPVHLYGRPADLDPILAIAARHGIAVVEDACQAHGARYRGRRLSTFGQAAAFSFYPPRTPAPTPTAESVYHLFVVYVDARDRVREALAARGVGTAVHYPRPVHLQGAYAGLGHGPGSFPHAERACERVLSMPLFPEMTIEQADYAARTLAEIVGAR